MSFKLITIQIINDLSPQHILKKLNQNDHLSNIRKELENNIIDDTLLFLKKVDDKFDVLKYDEEENFHLKEIIKVENEQNILYLKRIYWNFFRNQRKLDYGCTMSYEGIKKASKRAFIMKNCESTEIGDEGYKEDQLKFKSKEDWMMKMNLFFSSNINVQNFIDLGISVESSHEKYENVENILVYEYIETRRVYLRFREHLEPTEEFIKEIKVAINSDNPEKEFRKIMKNYGQFIPTEIFLGGRVYKNIIYTNTRILGGEHFDNLEDFDKEYWIKSLNDYKNWDCIEFKNPISIFQLLPENIYKQIIYSIGKKILYSRVISYKYSYESRSTIIYELNNIPQNITEIIQNKDGDCDIFAKVVDDKNLKNVIFSCQILKSEKAKPSILINCIQKEFRPLEFYSRIDIVVIGYDLNFRYIYSDDRVELRKFVYDTEKCEFDSIPLQRELVSMIEYDNPFFGIPILNNLNSSNDSLVIGHNFRKTSNNEFKIDLFSYCSKTHRYVYLPKFTFCTFVILTNRAYNTTPFEFKRWGNPFITCTSGLFPSLYLLNSDGYSPIFIYQNGGQMNIEYVDCNCNKTCFICNNKTKRITKNDQISCTMLEISDDEFNEIMM